MAGNRLVTVLVLVVINDIDERVVESVDEKVVRVHYGWMIPRYK